MCHNFLKSLVVKAVKRPQLRHFLSSSAWFPDSSQHILALSGSEAHGLQPFSISPPPLLQVSTVASAVWSCPQHFPHTETAICKVKTFAAQMGWKHSTVPAWGTAGWCWWNSCPLASLQVENFPYTSFVHSNCKGAQYCFPFQITLWVTFLLHEVIRERKLSPFPSCLCFACISHYRCGGHGVNVSKIGGNK